MYQTNNGMHQWLIVLGVLLLIGGFIAYVYELRQYYGFVITHPYRDLGLVLIVLGVVLIIVGAVLNSLKKPEKEEKTFESTPESYPTF